MKIKVFLSALLCSAIVSAMPLNAQNAPVFLEQSEGIKELLTSQYSTPFWTLVRYYETQKTNTYCGIASSTMVLNALDIEKPAVPQLANYRMFTQDNFFTPSVRRIITEKQVSDRGMYLEEVTNALTTFSQVHVQPMYAETMTLDQFRGVIKYSMQTPSTFLIANYLRNYVGQQGSGHFSPIGAYNEKTDRVLILDVSRYCYSPAWIKVEDLYKSCLAISPGRSHSRGLLLVSKNNSFNHRHL